MAEPQISPPFLAKSVSELRVRDVVGASRPILSVRASDTVEHVVKFLSQHHISSAPLLDGSGLLVGLVDFSDILHHLVAFGIKANSSSVKSWDQFRALYLSDVSARNPILRVTPDSLLSEALDLLFSGVHRILVVDPENKRRVVNVLCQTDLLKFLNDHSEIIPIAKQLKSISTLGLGSQAARGFKLHSVLPTVKASEAFTIMRLTHMRALPIVDESGTLISQISASDISQIFSEKGGANLELLDLTVLDYVKKMRETSHAPLLVWVEQDDNAGSVLTKMIKKNVHRVFITDNLSRFQGVVTVTDLALMLC